MPLNLFSPEDLSELNKDLRFLMRNNTINRKSIKFKEYRFTMMLHRDHEIKNMTPERKIYLVDNFIIPAEINTLSYTSQNNPNSNSSSDNNNEEEKQKKEKKKKNKHWWQNL
ncbi:MAG: hypothetical protein U9532_00545 ['Conium maculatum' witches'-broom phytoplasma]|nr:hypothetical protein ['Conium maculatum' witches'-broom phytoplasma]